MSIPSYVYLIGALIAWIGLMLTWLNHIKVVSEQRRLKAVARGETAPDIRGVSNYERSDLRQTAHRAMQVTIGEKWISRAICLGVPAIILTIFITSASI
jgi:hypothetical protein